MQPVSTVSQILQIPAAEALEWIRSALRNEVQVPDQFGWQQLAEVIGMGGSEPDSELWLQGSLELHERLVATSQDEAQRERLLKSAMRIRALLLSSFPSVLEDPGQHVKVIVDWFMARLPMTLDQTEQTARQWTTLPITAIRTLRFLKNRMGIIQALRDAKLLDAYPEVQKWLAMRPKLP